MRRLDFSNYRRVYGLLWRTYGQSWHVRLSFILAFISRTAKFVGLPIAASLLIGSLAAQDYDQARQMVLLFAGFSLTIGILSPTIKYTALLGENDVYSDSMTSYFASLLNKDIKYFNDNMAGYVTTATRQYSDTALALIRRGRDKYLGTVYSMIVPIVIIAIASPKLGALVFVLAMVQAIYLLWASYKIEPYRSKARELYKQNSGFISDAITNIVAIKSTAQESVYSKLTGKHMREESVIFMQRYKVQAKLIMAREVITVSFFLALFWVTVMQIINGSLGVAGAVLVVTYSFTIMTAVYDLSDALDEHDDLVDKVLPVFDLMEQPNQIADPARPKKLGKVKGEIIFDNVSFGYVEADNQIPVFDGLSFTVPAGQKLGIVGLSGAGKSTLAKLLLRFEDVQAGQIKLDGTPISAVKQTDLRQQIAYVPQEPLLFHSSIKDNIQLSDHVASFAHVKKAAELAHAATFIKNLPNGYDSVVGERGVKLSGGQKQRVAIARAVLQNAPIMLLDEATSALDSESEQIIKDSFAKILKGKTAIVIAHRLSTLADMDRIILLHEGTILEDGTHKDLLHKNGVYAKLWNRQKLHPEDLEVNDRQLERL